MRALILSVVLALSIPFAANAESAASLNQQGVKLFEAGDLDSAVFYFIEALKLDAESDTIRGNLANAYQAQASRAAKDRDWDRAMGRLERAVNVDPMNAAPLIHLGSLFLTLEENGSAIFRLEEAIELDPDSPEAHFLLGEAYYRDNDVVAALEQWEWVSDVRPGMEGLRERLVTARREAKVEEDYEWKQSRRFSITYNPDLRSSELREIIRILEKAYTDIGRALNGAYPPVPIQVTLYEAEEFGESTQMKGHIAAIYDGTRIRCPVLLADDKLVPKDELEEVLFHEYVHVVVRYLAPRDVPWWLNEGLAEELSHDLGDDDFDLLGVMLERELFRGLDELSNNQLNKLSPQNLALAYLQSHATVAYLRQYYGLLNVKAMLRRIDDGEEAELALRKVCRLSYETLELAVEAFIEDYR